MAGYHSAVGQVLQIAVVNKDFDELFGRRFVSHRIGAEPINFRQRNRRLGPAPQPIEQAPREHQVGWDSSPAE